jgi:hypothetical protein
MLDSPASVLSFLLRLGYPPEEVARTVAEKFGLEPS